ncbi:hypothetical protein DPMN_055068 [Dreissena polymorpha]|uniref:Uncharacterized protein n=1 Tax=Dreissena polymorpha TaxID=45954 RepID=A0A9D4CPA3_DREPO|nr:hypothetical protein DPMN_055068 [Dreissena polymorpha]
MLGSREHPGSHVFQQTRTFSYTSKISLKQKIKTKKNAPPNETGTIFKLVQDIIGTNLLTKFHDDRKINMASRVLTRTNTTPLGGHFHDDRTINVASRVKNAPPPCGQVFKATETIFELIQYVIETNHLTKFHEDRKIIWPLEKNAPLPGGHVFQPTRIIFGLVQDIIGMNLLSFMKIGQYMWPLEKNAPPLGGHVFQVNITILKLIQDSIENNLLTKFHKYWAINVASRVKNAPPSATESIFELIQDIIATYFLTKFHEDRKINLVFRVLTL